MHLIYEMNRDPEETEESDPEDFMPDYFDRSGEESVEQAADQPTPQQLREKAKQITRMFGGKVND